MRPQIKGLVAAFAAIALMTSWGALAANDSRTTLRNVEATVYVDKKDGGDTKDLKQPHVEVEVQPLGGDRAKCSDDSNREYPASQDKGDRVYVLKTSGKEGSDYGRAYFSRCVRGQYQVSVRAPSGYKAVQEHQMVKVEQNKTARVEFVLEKQK